MDKHRTIEKIESLIESYQLDEAKEKISEILSIDNNNIEVLHALGKIETKTQQYGDALNTYTKILEIEEDNDKAHTAIKMINNILEIRRSFYFENTYTDDDLYF